MNRLLACLSLLLVINLLQAQALAVITGVDTSCEAGLEQATECLIFFEQPGGGDTLHLKWRRIEVNAPAGWDFDLCDYGACYIGIPAQGEMWPATGGQPPYLKLVVQPGNFPGTAWLSFRVSLVNDPENYIDVFFNPHTPGVVSTSAPAAGTIRVFPNPAADFVVLENTLSASTNVRVLNTGGQVVWQRELAAETRMRLDAANWPPGLYLIENGRSKQRLIKR